MCGPVAQIRLVIFFRKPMELKAQRPSCSGACSRERKESQAYWHTVRPNNGLYGPPVRNPQAAQESLLPHIISKRFGAHENVQAKPTRVENPAAAVAKLSRPTPQCTSSGAVPKLQRLSPPFESTPRTSYKGRR